MKVVLLLLAAIAVPLSAKPAERLFAGGSWTALRFDRLCVAAARPLPPAGRRAPDARAGFRFEPAARRLGEFHARLSKAPRPGSSVLLKVGNQPFLLVAQGQWAWSRSPAQDGAIIAAVRAARSMRLEGRDGAGRRFADAYLLDGAPTAIDAAAAACAGQTGR